MITQWIVKGVGSICFEGIESMQTAFTILSCNKRASRNSLRVAMPAEVFHHLSTLQSETWLVHAKVHELHVNPPVRLNFPRLALVLRGKARKVHTNRAVQMWLANFRVNQPCFRLECRERC